ncbi:MAG: protein kinase domain-containing protein [Streptosporangiaceae bacterium]
MTEETSSAVFSTTPGRRIAGYQIESELGRGGMAIVYRARDVNLGRVVALKVLAPQLARDDSFRQRFIRESRAAAAVDHPHIIPVYEAGEADGELFIAMRYVSTGDVRTLLDSRRMLPVARVVSIVAQVASALDAAHARGLVHRDVKPANMLLAESADGGSDHVYLSDFGLSKQSLAAISLTATGQFLGTLDYVAPEQIEGRPVDGRADLYALACATVEMLTGFPPFRRAENIALMYAQLSEPPPKLRERRPELPAAVDQVMGRALAKSPGDRYPGCADFAAALRAACTPGPVPRTMAETGLTPGYLPTQVVGRPVAPSGESLPASWFRDAPAVQHAPAVQPGPAVRPGPEARPAARSQWPPDPRDSRLSAPQDWPSDPTAALAPTSRLGEIYPQGAFPAGAGAPPWPGKSRPPRRTGRKALIILGILSALVIALALGRLADKLAHHGNHASSVLPRTSTVVSPGSALSRGSTAPSSVVVAGQPPVRVVRAYFRAINGHRYRDAWLLGGHNIHITYANYVAGFAGTAHDAVQILRVSGNVVTARITATQTNGTVKVFAGTYTVQEGQITVFNVARKS